MDFPNILPHLSQHRGVHGVGWVGSSIVHLGDHNVPNVWRLKLGDPLGSRKITIGKSIGKRENP